MKLKLSLILLSVILAGLSSCNSENSGSKSNGSEPKIVPHPDELITAKGSFTINSKTQIKYSDISLLPLAELLIGHFNSITTLELEAGEGNEGENSIILNLDPSLEGEESKIDIGKNVVLSAGNYNALSFAAASLIQLINQDRNKYSLPYLSIVDKPDYEYRAVLLDLARFWHPMETIKETIDLLWYYKIPYLQIHMSDNRRFTFPMDKYPDLKTIRDGKREYYTKEELAELVEYAKQRGVAIIPEIDMPGHSAQLFTKYPKTFGSVDPKTEKATYMHVINIAKEECYTACEDIINQLAEVFYTSPYIHFGGDEVYFEVLKQVPEYKEYCKKNGLDEALKGNAQELFCHFINRMHKVVKATGKKTILWEGFPDNGAGKEIIDTDITIIAWNTSYNHPENLISSGFNIVNSTWMPWYMVGAMNFAPSPERAFEWDLTDWSHWNEKFESVKLESKEGLVGGQICFWEQNYYKVIPVLRERVPILAEKLWNNNLQTDFNEYQLRQTHADSRYMKMFQPIEISFDNLTNEHDLRFIDKAIASLSSLSEGQLKWSFNESWGIPDLNDMNDYERPFNIENSGILSVQLIDDGGDVIGYPIQKYLQKIEPGYEYKAYGPAPVTGWKEMPDFDTLNMLRSGLIGKMNEKRLGKINGELFAKVKAAGHIDTRMNGLYNQYALELSGSISIENTDEYVLILQTHDGLAELYIDDKLVAKGKEFGNKAEEFNISLLEGDHKIRIKYFYKQIQNQLSIMYKAKADSELQPFENLVETIDL